MSCQSFSPSPGLPGLSLSWGKRFIYSGDDALAPDSLARTGGSRTCRAATAASSTACDGGPSLPTSSLPTSSLPTSSTRESSVSTIATAASTDHLRRGILLYSCGVSTDWGEEHPAEEIDGLPAFTRDILIRASCIGSYFDDYVMRQVLYLPCIDDEIARTPSFRRRGRFAKAIADAEDLGIVEKVGQMGYQFRRNSLSKAFYDRLPRDSREEVHLEIGRVMKKALRRRSGRRPSLCPNWKGLDGGCKMFKCSPADMTKFIQRYSKIAADQLERGKDRVSTREELAEISSLSEQAGELSSGGQEEEALNMLSCLDLSRSSDDILTRLRSWDGRSSRPDRRPRDIGY